MVDGMSGEMAVEKAEFHLQMTMFPLRIQYLHPECSGFHLRTSV